MVENSLVILIVEDDVNLADALALGLNEAGYTCHVAGTVAGARQLLKEMSPALILLDMGLPDAEGIDVLDWVRKLKPTLPVIITTARSEVSDRVNGLERGADDYLVKPYAFEELLARIRTQLRHVQRSQVQQRAGDLFIDLSSRTASRAGQLLDLTPREFDLLAYMVSLQGEVATREMLQHEIWKVHSTMTSMDNVIDVHVSRLRQKLNIEDLPPLLHTVRGVGFILKEEK